MQKAFIAAVATATIGASSIGAATAFAATPGTHPQVDNLVKAIATKFNLQTNEVQRVFDEQRALGQATRQAERIQHIKESLAKAVTDGKLTQAQADLVTAKRAELEANKPDPSKNTPEEMKKIMQTHRDELQSWAKENDIPLRFILPARPPMMGEGRGMMR